MKLIIFAAIVAVAAAHLGGSGPSAGYGGGHRGYGGGHRGYGGGHRGYGGGYVDYYAVPDYHTAYAVKDAYSGVAVEKEENRKGYKTEGSYSSALPDGRIQVVKYWVDGDSGYNADVKYLGVAKHPKTPIRSAAYYPDEGRYGRGYGPY